MSKKSIFIKFFRNVKHMFNNVLLMDLEHFRSLTAKKRSAISGILCRKDSKM
jgi:hypothetical protein